jgi:hypothetical protein
MPAVFVKKFYDWVTLGQPVLKYFYLGAQYLQRQHIVGHLDEGGRDNAER